MTTRRALAAIVLSTVVAVGGGLPAFADDETISTATVGAPEATAESSESDAAPAPTSETTTVQVIDVESVQIGVANTGGNSSASSTEPASTAVGAAQGTDLATGSAAALGSQDTTAIDQRVATDVDESSTVDIAQISIVFNIGLASANSGDNALAADEGDGADAAISTGTASAIGNDAQTYVTQAARSTAGPRSSDEVTQQTSTVQIGISVASTGLNTAASSTSAGGSASAATGSATAVGNSSATAVTQSVEASARNGAHVRVDQRATIVNLGLAYADSGSNRIGQELAMALAASDADTIEQLLLPIVAGLLPAADAAAGSGVITTGDAVAMGNRSSTQVLQLAVGEADAGSVGIRQEVVVVNAGVGVASSGGNAIGLVSDRPMGEIDEAVRAVVTDLADFLRGLLLDIDAWSSGESADLAAERLSMQLGDVDIGIDRSLAAQTVTAGASVTTRQLAAVVSLAVARSNSGSNRVSTRVTDPGAIDAVRAEPTSSADLEALVLFLDESPVIIVTGDASARNLTLQVLCQRRNAADVECLAPPETPSDRTPPSVDDGGTPDGAAVDSSPSEAPGVAAVPVVSGAVQQTTRTLPATGAEIRLVVLAGLILVLLGSTMVVTTRRVS